MFVFQSIVVDNVMVFVGFCVQLNEKQRSRNSVCVCVWFFLFHFGIRLTTTESIRIPSLILRDPGNQSPAKFAPFGRPSLKALQAKPCI